MKKVLMFFLLSVCIVGCSNAKNNDSKNCANSTETQGAVPAKWKLNAVLQAKDVAAAGDSTFFSIEPISDSLLQRMKTGGSYPANCTISRDDLRYVKVLYCNYNKQTVCGELVCNKAIAEDLRSIFLELYRAKYEIERMVLIDDYHAIDEESMSHNNTSSFCFRKIAGSTKLSKHAMGMAVDVNTQHNPYVKFDVNGKIKSVEPNTAIAKEYAKRTPLKAHMINRNDLCYKLFIKHGFRWGGDWKSGKDYQHFEK